MAVLHTKTDTICNLKSNSTLAKQITSRFHKSIGLIIIHILAFSSVIIKTFSRNLNYNHYVYKYEAYTVTVYTCRSKAKIARLVYLLVTFILLAVAIKSW